MYIHIAVLASFILIYNLFAEKIEKTTINGPLFYLIFGVIAGPVFLGVLNLEADKETYKILAELALALVLFTDASNANIKTLNHNLSLPIRLLFIGLPLTILFGYVAGSFIFNDFGWLDLAILATILAPTDAALGKAVATNPKVPSRIRESLNVESGLNDGICVPILLLLMSLVSVSSEVQVNFMYGLQLFGEQIGYGVLVGVGVTYVGTKLIHYSISKNWINGPRKAIIIIALTFTCYAISQIVGGSGFIACFSAGLLYGILNKKRDEELIENAEGIGDTLGLITWVVFGAVVVGNYFTYFTWDTLLYAILSLTVVRVIPVVLVLSNSGLTLYEKIFTGWFGPRGLASIVFAVMILDLDLPHKGTLIITIVLTILLSVILHGITANPFIKMLLKNEKK
ncbi:cation:proton antiporter [Formosa sp. PL04]|uniref:cation:proton antiporter n=1 Tax=Formosa sp. PL04 TaxID=3081755 RepID=UPI00298114BB|nr:cation:proton antiporter [Formosa sp. PL04]MDW5290610.1 cation:proton antiporter [Formosa sp. PL04]